jgi:branched-chain amino acid transport system permease protein
VPTEAREPPVAQGTAAQTGLGPAPQALSDRWGLVALPLTLGLLALLETLLSGGEKRTWATIFMFVALAQAWNLIGGFAGYASFGNAAFFGLGAYTTASLMAKEGMSYWLTLPAAGAMGLVFAVLVGIPVLRLRGHYFAIATLGVAEGTREIVTNLNSITGGGSGITVPAVGSQATTAYLGKTGFYYLFLALAVLAVLVVWIVSRSRFGYALRAIHQDEDAAGAMGINTTVAKVSAFGLSGLLTGLVGSAFAFQQVTIYPDRSFDVEITVLMVVMAVLGGSGTVLGPIVGAFTLEYLSEYLRSHFTNYHTFIFGGLIIVAVVFIPQGLVPFARDAWRERRLPILETVRAYRL